LKRIFFLLALFSLLLFPVHQSQAQSLSATETTISVFESSVFSQVIKDFRRWEIIAFGAFPFAMFNVSFVTDLIRWNNANQFDFSEQGRRYAPWPLKSAGGVEMTSNELRRIILIAAGVSLLVASIDLTIVLIKRNREKKRIDNMPSGSVTIERIPAEDGNQESERGDSSPGGGGNSAK